MTKLTGLADTLIGGDSFDWGKLKKFWESCKKFSKYAALIIALFLCHSVLKNADQPYTNFAALKDSMLNLFWIAVLVGYYLGGAPTTLRSAAVVAMVVFLMFVFVQKTPLAITNKVIQAFHSNPVSTTSVTTVSTGKSLAIDLQPNQIYDVDDLTSGQKWRYLSFNGSFSHRISKNDGQACWKLVDNNLPWSADYAGKLQIKAGNTPVKLAINIL